jgi:phosphoglycolate phosphatase-like HAD superfamily hydrolase
MIILIDLDHTVSDAFWRDGMIEAEDWDSYHLASDGDAPISEMVSLVNSLSQAGHEVVGFTARPDKWRGLTMAWLVRHGVMITTLLMRADEDYRPSDTLKMALAEEFGIERVDMIIDDREDVCLAFKAKGITALMCMVRGK